MIQVQLTTYRLQYSLDHTRLSLQKCWGVSSGSYGIDVYESNPWKIE
jgi:hypothetical protein